MQESTFTNYDQLPLFLNANTVAQAVSYTHLDVYKRQIPNNGIITINIKSCLIIRNSLIKSRKNMNTMLLSCILSLIHI